MEALQLLLVENTGLKKGEVTTNWCLGLSHIRFASKLREANIFLPASKLFEYSIRFLLCLIIWVIDNVKLYCRM